VEIRKLPWVELESCGSAVTMIDLENPPINGGNGHRGIVFDNGDEPPSHIGKGLGELKQTSGRNNWAVLDYFW